MWRVKTSRTHARHNHRSSPATASGGNADRSSGVNAPAGFRRVVLTADGFLTALAGRVFLGAGFGRFVERDLAGLARDLVFTSASFCRRGAADAREAPPVGVAEGVERAGHTNRGLDERVPSVDSGRAPGLRRDQLEWRAAFPF